MITSSPVRSVKSGGGTIAVPVSSTTPTGTAIVPPPDFTLRPGDEVIIATTGLGELRNVVEAVGAPAEGG